MTKPLNKNNNDDSMNNSFSVRANYSNKINNVPSKIKSQVDADKKIYGLLKKNQNQNEIKDFKNSFNNLNDNDKLNSKRKTAKNLDIENSISSKFFNQKTEEEKEEEEKN